jgi:hypothetical protein
MPRKMAACAVDGPRTGAGPARMRRGSSPARAARLERPYVGVSVDRAARWYVERAYPDVFRGANARATLRQRTHGGRA